MVATELYAGALAGAAGILASQPMDTIRVRLQSSGTDGMQRYQGIVDCGRTVLRQEGVRGWYKGVWSPVFAVGVVNSILFCTYENATQFIKRRNSNNQLSLSQIALAGGLSGLATSFITGPVELVKCLAQTNVKSTGNLRETWDILNAMLKRHGLTGAHGPMRGMMMTMMRDVPAYGLYFPVYEGICRHFNAGEQKSMILSFNAGGCAGVMCWAAVYPIDVLKTRWQTAGVGKYSSVRHCLHMGIKNEGWGFLYKGFGATMLRAWNQCGIIFVTYEFTKRKLDEIRLGRFFAS